MKEEFCIMPPSPYYKTERFPGSHKHHVFGGANRWKSDEYGLVVFLTPEAHNMSDKGIHANREFDLYVKRIAQRAAMEEYGWTIDNFREIFGKNYL